MGYKWGYTARLYHVSCQSDICIYYFILPNILPNITHVHWFLKFLSTCRCLIIVVVSRVRWSGRGEEKEQERESLDDHTLALLAKDPYTFQIDLGSRGAGESSSLGPCGAKCVLVM